MSSPVLDPEAVGIDPASLKKAPIAVVRGTEWLSISFLSAPGVVCPSGAVIAQWEPYSWQEVLDFIASNEKLRIVQFCGLVLQVPHDWVRISLDGLWFGSYRVRR